MTGCRVCAIGARTPLPPRESVEDNGRWRVAHAFDSSLPGWLVLLPHRHITALTELTTEEAGDLGPLLQRLSAALARVTGCPKTYVMLFAEAEGFAHLHIHVVPRPADLPPERTGPRIFGYLGAGPGERLSEQEPDRVAIEVRAALQIAG